jgi:hypothetical protein
MLHDQGIPDSTISVLPSHDVQARKRQSAVSFCLMAFLFALLPLSVFAQATRTQPPRPVRFIRGHAVVSGSARQYTRYVYTFRASEGQGFGMRITGGVTVTLLGPDPANPLVEDETEGFNSGLPNTGIYKIIVTNKSEGTISVPFKLEMSLSEPERY